MCFNRNLILIHYCCLYNKIYAANFDTTDGTGVGADEENDRNVIGPAFARGKLNRVLVRQSYLILSYRTLSHLSMRTCYHHCGHIS